MVAWLMLLLSNVQQQEEEEEIKTLRWSGPTDSHIINYTFT